MVANMATSTCTSTQELDAAYYTLFPHGDVTVEVDQPSPNRVSTYSKLLLQKYEEKSNVLLQLSIYRALFVKHRRIMTQSSCPRKADSITVPATLSASERDPSRALSIKLSSSSSCGQKTERSKAVPEILTTGGASDCGPSENNKDSEKKESVLSSVTCKTEICAAETLRLNVCKSLLAENDSSVIQILMDYLTSSDQFVSFSASKALASFLLCIKTIKMELLEMAKPLISLETCQTHVSVYTLQAFTDVLKALRKSCDGRQGDNDVALWKVIGGVLKQSLQMFHEAKVLCKRLHVREENEKEKEESPRVGSEVEQRIQWVELTMDAFLSLLIETLRHFHACYVTDDIQFELRELICHNLSQFTSFLETSKSVYVLKQLIYLHFKILTNSMPLTHSSILTLFQSDAFIETAQSWLGTATFIGLIDHAGQSKCSQISGKSSSPLQSSLETNEQDLSLESSLVATVMRKGVLLLLNYLAFVLTNGNKENRQSSSILSGCVHLEELLSSLSQLLHQTEIVEPSLSTIIRSARRHLLELLSEQDSCLLEGLLLSCDIIVALRESCTSFSSCDHPTLNFCLKLISVHHLFIEFLSAFIFFDHSLLIDYFISPETSLTFRQFLSQYLSLAVKEWPLLIQVCKESDRSNEEIGSDYFSDPVSDVSSTSKSKIEEYATICNVKGLPASSDGCQIAVKRSRLDLLNIESSTEGYVSHQSACLGKVFHDKKLIDSYDANNVDGSLASFNECQPTRKRPRFDLLDSDLSTEDWNSCQREEENGKMVGVSVIDLSTDAEVSTCESEVEEEDSDLVYRETCLDKMMDCLTHFKYSLKRLHSSRLLTTTVGEAVSMAPHSCYPVEGIVDLVGQLEELYEAMDN